MAISAHCQLGPRIVSEIRRTRSDSDREPNPVRFILTAASKRVR